MKPHFTCCGRFLSSRKAVLDHIKTATLTPEDRKESYSYCNIHCGRFHSNCQGCVDAAWVNKIDRSLHKRGLRLSQYL